MFLPRNACTNHLVMYRYKWEMSSEEARDDIILYCLSGDRWG